MSRRTILSRLLIKPLSIAFLFSSTSGSVLANEAVENSGNSHLVNEQRIVGVTTASVESLVFYPKRNAPAKVEALNQTNVPAQISAVVDRVIAKVGDSFKLGEALAELDCREKNFDLSNQKAQLKRLSDSFEFEKRQLSRGKKLAKQRTIGEAELDNLKTNVALAQAQLASQKSNLGRALLNQQHCTVKAPYSGMVVGKMVSVGDMVAIGSQLFEVVELNNSEITASISLNDSQSFEQANNYYFENHGVQYPLTKRLLLPMVQNQTRSREARLDFMDQQPISGTTGRLYWKSPIKHLPANLLQERNGQKGVFVLDKNAAKFVEVPGAQEGRPIILKNYIQWQELQLIMDGRHGLVNGQSIAVDEGE